MQHYYCCFFFLFNILSIFSYSETLDLYFKSNCHELLQNSENFSCSYLLVPKNLSLFPNKQTFMLKLIDDGQIGAKLEFLDQFIYFYQKPKDDHNLIDIAFEKGYSLITVNIVHDGEDLIFLEKNINYEGDEAHEIRLKRFNYFPIRNLQNKAICGDGVRNGEEQCDDNNTISGDGCSNVCVIEAFYDCSGKNGTYCYDKRPPYCILEAPENHFFMKLNVYLKFSKIMENIDFRNTTLVKISVSGLNSSTDFEWDYNVLDDKKTYNFVFYFKVSFQRRILEITFLKPQLIHDLHNISITQISYSVKTPIWEFIYYTESNLNFFNIIDIVISYLMIVLLFAFVPLLILDSLSIFWIYIEMLQVMSLILFINVDYPDNTVIFFRALLPAIFIKNNYLDFFTLDSLGYQEISSLPYALKEEKISTKFVYNAFFALLFLGFTLAVYILNKILIKIVVVRLSEKRICSWFVNICCTLDDLMEYSALIRVSLVTFIPINLAAILQFTNLQFSSTGNILNSVLALSAIVFQIIFFFLCAGSLTTLE